MKKFKGIVLPGVVLFLCIAFAACDNILTTSPEDAISSTEFFQNEGQVEQAVIGAYSKLQDMYGNQWKFSELRSDNTIVQYNVGNFGPHPIWLIDEFTMTSTNTNIEPYWGDVYQGIQKCNAVLNNIDRAGFETDGLKEQLTAEVKFLRAFYYFHLVRLFGGVPLVLDQVESPSQAFDVIGSRADAQAVYDQIIQDASDAAQVLPQSYSGENNGRATEGAARTLLAEVYLTQGEYASARTELESVMQLGYELVDNYEDIFDPANKYHEEYIFDVSYAELESNRELGNNLIYQFAPHNSGSAVTGDNGGTPQGLNIPTRDILNAYEQDDLRKDASIGYYVDPGNTEFGIAIGDTILYVNKYASDHSVLGRTNDNIPVYRYAHVILMMAEVINEIEGPTSEAYGYIDEVRQRAGLDPLTAGLSKADFRDAVYHEQRVELAFENHRWYNLLRQGRAMEVMQQHAPDVKDIQPHFTEPVYIIEEYKLLYPIPERERTLNADLAQNPGW
ncbi:RagB/SusD family nutrient uptake outer membrane protein [Halalkalibaculum sp. DA3122]|uniref:RagB/SusD family nutrient uptake outer membrane protein n=1 Tax=Halalkalibaculum sp. DA3122 TaxID=3373607 RepID=UPI00375433A3